MRGNNKKQPQPPKFRTTNNMEPKLLSFQNLTISNEKTIKFSSAQQEYRYLKQQNLEKQQQLIAKQKMYRIQLFKNSNMKDDIQRVDKEFQKSKLKITIDVLQKNKNNKDSPLFYNQNGLSPMELTLVEEKKHRSGVEQSFVCMICFQDIQENQIVIDLPCEHCFHKDCGIQHLLGSKFCPNCSEIVDLVEYEKRKSQ